MLESIIISSILETGVAFLLAFLLWLSFGRKKERFFKWLGIKGIEKRNRKPAALSTIAVTLVFLGVSFFILYMVKDIETATSEFKGLGIKALPAALVYAFFNTALPEELAFRGFLLKRLANKFGFTAGNIIQSVLFGFLHGAMFFTLVGAAKTVIIIAFTTAIAFLMGYVNEKKANGSILPSWIIHALSNLFSACIAMFSII
ncbi:MAG: CPBP family intramembrane metalloprotease [Clostridia bacterium]|nr:CPBP family intramembrane metalloprotease [Clostridia bacterium]